LYAEKLVSMDIVPSLEMAVPDITLFFLHNFFLTIILKMVVLDCTCL